MVIRDPVEGQDQGIKKVALNHPPLHLPPKNRIIILFPKNQPFGALWISIVTSGLSQSNSEPDAKKQGQTPY